MTILHDKLRYYRNVNHKSIDDIIAFLREHDYDVSEKTIYAWENGSNQPRRYPHALMRILPDR